MLMKKDSEPVAREVTDRIELDAYVEPRDRTHHDRYAELSHELTDDAAEATSRALIRGVPLGYGALLGGLADNILLGLAVGLVLSLAFDLNMGEKSIARGLFRGVCPAFAEAAHLLARLLRLLGLAAPAALGELRCRAGAPRT